MGSAVMSSAAHLSSNGELACTHTTAQFPQIFIFFLLSETSEFWRHGGHHNNVKIYNSKLSNSRRSQSGGPEDMQEENSV